MTSFIINNQTASDVLINSNTQIDTNSSATVDSLSSVYTKFMPSSPQMVTFLLTDVPWCNDGAMHDLKHPTIDKYEAAYLFLTYQCTTGGIVQITLLAVGTSYTFPPLSGGPSGPQPPPPPPPKKKSKTTMIIIIVIVVALVFLLSLLGYVMYKNGDKTEKTG